MGTLSKDNILQESSLVRGEKWIGGGLREQIDFSIKRYVLAKKET